MASNAPTATPGAKMMYLIRRRPGTSREELIANWFANHMPSVIRAQEESRAAGKLHAHRYIATLFDAAADGAQPWDGVAQLWWDRPLPAPTEPHGATPRDTFQQKAEPYSPWATTEYVVIDGSDRLPVAPNTLNAPFPCTRSGFCKVTALVAAKPGADHDAFYTHWLDVHVPNVAEVMGQVGGFRYVVSHSLEPAVAPYAGMAELYFEDADGWRRFNAALRPDGMEQWLDPAHTVSLRAGTEMIGIP